MPVGLRGFVRLPDSSQLFFQNSFAHAQMLVWFPWLPADCSLQSCIALWDLAARGALLLLLHQLLGEGIFHFTQFSAPITPPRKGLSLAKGLCHMLRALFFAFGSAFAFPFALTMFRASPKMSRTPSVAQRNRPTWAFSMCRPSRSTGCCCPVRSPYSCFRLLKLFGA